jgi:CelD/BcsL family acetyltransferase involved in cellulose biosynthesis
LARWRQAASASGLWSLVRWEKPWYRIDLAAIRSGGRSYMDSLSANTRYQIRRARKIYASRGELVLRHAATLLEAQAWFEHLGKLHQHYWTSKGEPGAFATAQTQRFHAALVNRAWPRGAVEIAKVLAGDHVVGYLYNFRKGGTLYNYQSGLAYEDDAKLKPGLVCHTLTAEDALERGLQTYDLLAGSGHYKQSLSNETRSMAWAVLQQRRLTIGIENGLRSVRDRWRDRFRAAPQQPGKAAIAS